MKAEIILEVVIVTLLTISSLLRLFTYLGFIYLASWSLKSIKIESILRKNHVGEVRLLFLFLAIAIGYAVGSFFLLVADQLNSFVGLLLQLAN